MRFLNIGLTIISPKHIVENLTPYLRVLKNLISQHPNIGIPTDDPKVRHKLVRDYSLFYELREDSIIILTVWDNKQDPDKLTFNE